MLKFNERFREAREYFGMNKADFAKKLQMSPTTVTRYESGSMDIAMGSIDDVAAKLGIRLEWLLGLSDNMFDSDLEYRNIPILKSMVEFECTLRQARRKKRLTQQDVSDRTGIAVNKISEYENNRKTMNMQTLFNIADVVGCGIEEIYRKKDTSVESLFMKRTPAKRARRTQVR